MYTACPIKGEKGEGKSSQVGADRHGQGVKRGGIAKKRGGGESLTLFLRPSHSPQKKFAFPYGEERETG